MTQKTFIIAEAGVNHNGDISLAKELIDIAIDAQADAVKFQTFTAEKVISIHAPQAEYQVANTGTTQSQLDMVKTLELSYDDFIELRNYTSERDIIFMSTAFDHDSMKFLVEKCNIPRIKIPSGEITNAPFLLSIGRYKMPMILSTGMANLDEIEHALAILSYGWSHKDRPSSLQQCIDFYQTDEGRSVLKNNIDILHCVTEYPAPYIDVNLRAMQTIAEKFGYPIGLSDHTKGIHIPLAAVAMGATIIEKHYTIDRTLKGPDHKASLEPHELKNMVTQIRDIEDAMGNGDKKAQESEKKNIAIARRSLVASKPIAKGELFTENNITCKRPGNGVSPLEYWKYLERKADRNIAEDEVI